MRKFSNDLTAEYIRSILDYDPEMGIFSWKNRSDVPKRWNARYAGRIAGKTDNKKRIVLKINNKSYLASRIAWIFMTDEWPENLIDHRDMNPSNNRWDNLREANDSQNQSNRACPNNNKCGVKGVHAVGNRYRAMIKRNIHLGYFETKEEALMAYSEASKKMFGEFARAT
jgi:hypothetical protein